MTTPFVAQPVVWIRQTDARLSAIADETVNPAAL